MEGEARRTFLSWKWFIVLIVLAILVFGVWFVFFSYDECDSWECFNDNLESCGKARFIRGTDMIFDYTILGSSGDECRVEAKLLQGDLNNQDSLKLEGHEMVCSLPIGVVMLPESDISLCHGLLKEGLQDLVIQKLHVYLVQNLGQLNLEVLDIPEI